jgi:hypothetical protein
MPPAEGNSAAARTAAATACRFLFGRVCGDDAGKTKKRRTVYGHFTAFHKYGGDFGGGIPIRGYDFPRIAARCRFAQAAENPQMDVPLYQKYAGASQENPPEAAALRAGGFLCLSAALHGGRPRMGEGQGDSLPKSGGFF